MIETNIYTFPKLKIDLSNHFFIKYDIFEVNINFPPRGTPIGIISNKCEHHKITYIPQWTKNISWDHAFLEGNINDVCILSIGRKEPTTVQQVIEGILSQQLTEKWNRVHIITAHRDNKIVRTNIQ